MADIMPPVADRAGVRELLPAASGDPRGRDSAAGGRPSLFEGDRSAPPGAECRQAHAMSVLLLESEDVAWFRDDFTGARPGASRLAGRIGLSEHRAGEVALATSEAASNLVKHAVDGAIVLRVVRTAQQAGVEFLAVDRGPGMADVAASMRDGRSSAGTLGIGLGMVARLADTFDLHSIPGRGTVMVARFWPRDARSGLLGISGDQRESVLGGVTRPISGAQECGDGWAARWTTPGHQSSNVPSVMRRRAPVSAPWTGPCRGTTSPRPVPRLPPPGHW